MFVDYPKALYLCNADDSVTVQDAAGEAVARKQGYEMYAEIHARENSKEVPKEEAPAKRPKPKAK